MSARRALLVQQVAQPLLGDHPIGDVPQHEQPGDLCPAAVAQRAHRHRVVPLRAGGVGQAELALGRGARLVAFEQGGDVGQEVLGVASDQRGAGLPEDVGGGRVDVCHPALDVEHDHGLDHLRDQRPAGDGHQVEQPQPEDAPHEDRREDDEEEWRGVDLAQPEQVEVVQHVPDQRQQRGDDDDIGLPPVGPAHPADPLHEQPEGGDQQQPRVQGVHPEDRPRDRDRRAGQRAGGVVLRAVAVHEPSGGGHREQRQDDNGLDAQEGRGAPADAPTGRVLADEHPQGARHRDDADELEPGPDLGGGDGARRQLDGVAAGPEEDPEQHQDEARATGRGTASPDVPEHGQVRGSSDGEPQAERELLRHHDSRPRPGKAGSAHTVTSWRRRGERHQAFGGAAAAPPAATASPPRAMCACDQQHVAAPRPR